MITRCPHCHGEVEVEIDYGLGSDGPMARLAVTLETETRAIDEIVCDRLHLANLEAVAPTDRARQHLAQVVERKAARPLVCRDCGQAHATAAEALACDARQREERRP